MSTNSPELDTELLDFPTHWTQSARDAVESVLEARPTLAGPEWASLVEAANLISTADALDEVARAADYMSVGASGQPVLHPAVGASTAARTAAATILSRLTVGAAASGSSSTQRAQRAQRAANARWRSSK